MVGGMGVGGAEKNLYQPYLNYSYEYCIVATLRVKD